MLDAGAMGGSHELVVISRSRDLEIGIPFRIRLRCRAGISHSALFLGLMAIPVVAQVVTIDNSGKAVSGTPGQGATVDRRYAQIEPTHISLQPNALDPKTRIELMRFLQSDQGFAMRPFPRGHHGLTLDRQRQTRTRRRRLSLHDHVERHVGKTGRSSRHHRRQNRQIQNRLRSQRRSRREASVSSPYPDRRGGPDLNPVTQDNDEQEPTGARLTLSFKERIPELTGKEVEALLAPLISFQVKTPIQAFTDTLPPKLKRRFSITTCWSA